ncbi:septum formation inhibitor Maf [Muriicola sp.]|uniref:septum formation inhibitor Maf n=1 Tax=Muriicola sp. TaxID=2020856 RepID=UPI003561BF2C
MTPLFSRISILILFTFLGLSSCRKVEKKVAAEETQETSQKADPKPLTPFFKNYWYAGEAEITSYELEQARYGQLHPGKAVLIFVTEPFNPEKQVKADLSSPSNVSVLKLNATKNFLTGIYPYSVMSSTFYPVADNQHAIKVSSSIQEWCGQVFTQLNNREQFEVRSFSYFESEGDQELQLDKAPLENEIWTQIRIRPESLPTGEISMVPSLEYLRLMHNPIRAYRAVGELEQKQGFYTYNLSYPELERELRIRFTDVFPYTIESWEETYPSGFGPSAQVLTTKARKINSLKTPYWQQNGNEDVSLRDILGI